MDTKKRKPNGYWTKERCQEEARQYKSRGKFQKKCSGGYNAAKRMDLLDELFPIT